MPPRCQGTLFIPKTPEKHPRKKTLVLISAKNSCQTLCFSYPRKDDQAIDLIRDIWTVDLKVLVQRSPQSRAISQPRTSFQTKIWKIKKLLSNNVKN